MRKYSDTGYYKTPLNERMALGEKTYKILAEQEAPSCTATVTAGMNQDGYDGFQIELVDGNWNLKFFVYGNALHPDAFKHTIREHIRNNWV